MVVRRAWAADDWDDADLAPERDDAGPALAGLTSAQRDWALQSEQLWQWAHGIAALHPLSDVSDLISRASLSRPDLLGALNARDVRSLVNGLGAAVLQGAPVST